MIHALNFAEQPPAHWLFVNIQPQVFVEIATLVPRASSRLLERLWPAGHQLVLRWSRTPSPRSDSRAAGRCAQRRQPDRARRLGAGRPTSTAWRLRPEIVNSTAAWCGAALKAAGAGSSRRWWSTTTAALVLMEGVQTEDEALVALDANADLVQGEWRPAADLCWPT